MEPGKPPDTGWDLSGACLWLPSQLALCLLSPALPIPTISVFYQFWLLHIHFFSSGRFNLSAAGIFLFCDFATLVFVRLLSVRPRDLHGVDFIWFSTSVWEQELHELRQGVSQEPDWAVLSAAVSVCLCSRLVKCADPNTSGAFQLQLALLSPVSRQQ